MPAAKEGTIKASELLQKIKEQNYRCAYTDRELTPETATVDHVLPISRGGGNDIGNIAVVHKDVNVAKASLTYDEFVDLCREVVRVADQREADALHAVADVPMGRGGSLFDL